MDDKTKKRKRNEEAGRGSVKYKMESCETELNEKEKKTYFIADGRLDDMEVTPTGLLDRNQTKD